MSKFVKILLTVLASIAFIFIGGFAGNLPQSDLKGPLCLFITASFIGALVAIWKKERND